MSVELMRALSVASYIVACVFFLIAVVLFFVLNVPGTVSDLSGLTARRAIKARRKQNKASVGERIAPNGANADPDKPTDETGALPDLMTVQAQESVCETDGSFTVDVEMCFFGSEEQIE